MDFNQKRLDNAVLRLMAEIDYASPAVDQLAKNDHPGAMKVGERIRDVHLQLEFVHAELGDMQSAGGDWGVWLDRKLGMPRNSSQLEEAEATLHKCYPDPDRAEKRIKSLRSYVESLDAPP
jgi:hypothetical protein